MLVSDPSRRICLCYCVTAEGWRSLLGLVCKEKEGGCLSFVRHSIPEPSDRLRYTQNFAAEQWQRRSFLHQVNCYIETRITEALWRTFGCHVSSNFLSFTGAVVSLFVSGSSSFAQLLTIRFSQKMAAWTKSEASGRREGLSVDPCGQSRAVFW
jgi:hypothetical protein